MGTNNWHSEKLAQSKRNTWFKNSNVDMKAIDITTNFFHRQSQKGSTNIYFSDHTDTIVIKIATEVCGVALRGFPYMLLM